MSSWLGRQRKPELVALAERAGLDDVDGLRKEELVSLLDEHLMKNHTRLSGNSMFRDYYGRTTSPVKRNAATNATSGTDGEVKVRKRRVTKVKEETDRSEGASPSSPVPAVTISTPHESRSLASPRSASSHHVATFPPSPAVVTDVIESQTRRFSAAATDMLVATRAENLLLQLREACSSVTSVETIILLLEGFFIQRRMIPWRYAFSIPTSRILGSDSYSVFLPDFFVLLTDIYWSTTTLWALTNFWLPLVSSWLFNLTIRPVVKQGITTLKPRVRFDPLTFNVIKALLAWLVFSQGARFFGLFSNQTIDLVTEGLPLGYTGVMVGASIGMLASLYDAAQRK